MTALLLYEKCGHICIVDTLGQLYGYRGSFCIKSILATTIAVPICFTEIEGIGTRKNFEIEKNNKKKNTKDEHLRFDSAFFFFSFLSRLKINFFKLLIQPAKVWVNNLLDLFLRQKSFHASKLVSEKSDFCSAIQWHSKAFKIRGIYRAFFQTKCFTQPLPLVNGGL